SPLILFLGSASLPAPILGIPFVNDIYWTLFVELQFYIYVALLFPILISSKTNIRWILTSLLLVISFMSLMVGDKWIKLLLPFHLPVFLMGYFLFLLKTNRIHSLEFYLGLSVCALCCALLTGYCHALGYRIACIATLTTVIIAYGKNGWNWFIKIGEYSYSLYLFHWLFISALAHYARPYFTGDFGAIALFTITIVVCIASAKFFYVLIEKPSLNWAKKFADQKMDR
ncbi:MAG: acyltransferase family protein, partial [Flavobacteriales bacterium]